MPPRAVIGLDVGGTFLKGARVDEVGEIQLRGHEPIAREAAEALVAELARMVESLDQGRQAGAVGIGLPGIVDRDARAVARSPALPILNGFPISEQLAERVGRPVFIENDANAAALAEAWRGEGGGTTGLLFVTLGTGVGGGIVLGERVFAGQSGYAGEIGHLQVEADGVPCNCGSRGCLETVAGARGWKRLAEALLSRQPSSLNRADLEPPTIAKAARCGDAVALEVIDRVARAVAVGIAAALNLLNLDRVVLGGGISAAGDLLLPRITEETRKRTFPQVFSDCAIGMSTLGNDAGVLGAARTAWVGLQGESKRAGGGTR